MPRSKRKGPRWVLFVAVLIAGAALAAWLGQGSEGVAGEYQVEVVGPDGVLFAEMVQVDEATPLGALDAAAREGGFVYETRTYPQFGCGVYVWSVAGHAESGAHGWIYEVARDGSWMRPPMAACAFGLESGDRVRWSWSTQA